MEFEFEFEKDERECDRCVWHLSGSCSQWDCNPITERDVEGMIEIIKATR